LNQSTSFGLGISRSPKRATAVNRVRAVFAGEQRFEPVAGTAELPPEDARKVESYGFSP
jgi:hypothetical protein